MVLNTNIASLNAVRTLDGTSRQQATAMERLTSGIRINRSADDAAGLAVAQGMTSQIRGTEVAIRNANDGVGLLQTLDGATEEVVSMFQRMRELSIQSLNGSYNMGNRMQMQEEVQQIKNEISRIGNTTKFNGQNLMNPNSFGSAVVSANFAATSSQALSAAGINPSAIAVHTGWEAGSANRLGIPLLDFTSLSILESTQRLANPLSTIISTRISTWMSTRISGAFTLPAGAAASTPASAIVPGTRSYGSAVNQASTLIKLVDTAVSVISIMRSNWGSMQNRLESTISNLQNVNENLTQSRSRIMDTNFAVESATLARTQVLQQAGMSMLSQANQQSQQVMSLLQ